MENKNRCMMCSYFKRTDKDLPDFGTCTKNDFEVVSSDLACGDFDYALCGKCKSYNPCEFDKHHGYCQKNRGNKVVYGRAICDKFEPKEAQKCCCECVTYPEIGTFEVKDINENPVYKKMTEGRYPWGSDEDKVLKYSANDVTIIAEQMAKEKQKELEDKVEKYEKILIDILNETYKHPQLFEHNIHAYELIPGHIKFLRNSFNTMCDKYDPVFEENTKLKEEIERLKNQVKNLQTTNEESYKREEKLEDKVHKLERRLNEKVCRMKQIDCELIMPLTRVLYPRENKIYKPYSEVINDIKDLKAVPNLNDTMYEDLKYWKERCHNAETDVTTLNSKVEVLDRRNTNQSVIIGEKGKEIENLAKKNQELKWRNDNQSRMIQDLKKERDEIDDKYGKLKFKFCDMLQEKGELEETNNRYYKDNERLAKKNRELQIRVNDLLFQEKLNKSAFGYDYEEENGKLRVENEQLRNENECLRNRYPTYSAMKAEDKIEHIQKEAKKWKRKYKEAYDILQEFFGEHSNIMSISYDLSGDHLTLKLLYNDSAYTKHNRLEKARERMKKLD